MIKSLNNYICIAGLFIYSLPTVNAQEYKEFEFSKKPEFEISESQKMLDEALLTYKYSTEYIVDEEAEQQFTFVYSVKLVNSDKAIERNNKIYLTIGEGSNYHFQKARVISPSGKITELKKEDVKIGVYDDEGEEQKYYYYALEGLEKGSIIERATYRQNNSYYYGSLIYLQSDVVAFNQEFELLCPPHLEFSVLPVNNAPEAVKDTSIEEKNRWTVTLDSADKILDQPYLYPNTVKQGVLFKLDRNNATNRGDITTYANVNENVYTSVFPELSKKAQKRIDQIAKNIKLDKVESKNEKILLIENHLKNEFKIANLSMSDLTDVEKIYETKTMNNLGSCIMHAALLKKAGISNIEVVLTTDRTELPFHPEYEAYLFLRNYLLYIPEVDMYIAPTETFSRGKYIPANWSHNYGLHIKSMDVGQIKAYVGKVKFIEALPYTANTDTMNIEVDFSKDLSQPKVSIEKKMMGYSAQFIQPIIHLLDESAIEELTGSLKNMVHEDIKDEKTELKNVDKNDFGVKPLVISIETNNHPFVSIAGEDLLFKIGDLIGEQMELYQEESRQYDVNSENQRLYMRTIRFNVPEGYSVKNLDELKMSFKYGEGDDYDLYFVSTVEKDGDAYVLKCKEYYASISYPSERFDEYKEVINAAADFNKLVVVMTKE